LVNFIYQFQSCEQKLPLDLGCASDRYCPINLIKSDGGTGPMMSRQPLRSNPWDQVPNPVRLQVGKPNRKDRLAIPKSEKDEMPGKADVPEKRDGTPGLLVTLEEV
jgi:hypothetical protein